MSVERPSDIPTGAPSFGRRFLPLYGLGLAGLTGTVPTLFSLLAQEPAFPSQYSHHLPTWLPVAMASIGLAIMLALMVAIGCVAAPRLGLRSLLVERFTTRSPLLPGICDELPLALRVGFITVIFTAFVRFLFRLAVGGHPFVANSITSLDVLSRRMELLFYGTICGEFVFRWGLMSLLGWMLWKWVRWPSTRNDDGSPRAGMMWIVILICALALGIMRLHPIVYTLPLSPLRVARSIMVNGIFGVGAGWLFWKRSLEAGMMAQVVFGLVGILLTLMGLPL